MIRGHDDEPIATLRPLHIGKLIGLAGHEASGSRNGVCDPKPCVLLVEVNAFRIIFVLLLLVFFIGQSFRSKESDTFAIWRPSKILNSALSCCETSSLPSLHGEKENLLMLVTIRQKGKCLTVRRPACMRF